MEKFLMANGCALRCVDTQKGEKTLVLVHGYFESIEIFESLIDKLKSSYRIITFDVPGHGISSIMSDCHSMDFIADVIEDILKKSGIERCWIAGHSMGGYIAAKYAQKYNHKCDGLIMIHSIFDQDSPERKNFRKREIELIKNGKKELIARLNPGKCFAKDNRNKFSEVISDLEDQAIMTEEDGIIALQNGMLEREDLNDFAKNATIPIVCFWGEFDEFFPLDYSKTIAEKHPNIKSHFMKNSGHMSFMEEQKLFVEIIKETIG